MIQIKEIGFSNMFSYGSDNVFTIGPNVTQLLGKNGDGKSSIAAIIEEIFYNKNSRGIKKADIANRYSGIKGYDCYAIFSVGDVLYRLEKTVQASAKVKLLKDGVDVSGHTATQTYKDVERILNMEFSTFTKLVYQSMVSSLDFLSATDANRKKFLVSLLGLEKYVEAEKTLKEAVKKSKTEMATVEGAIQTVKSWIASNSEISEPKEPVDVPSKDPSIDITLVEQKAALANVSLHNQGVKANLENIRLFDAIILPDYVAPSIEDSAEIAIELEMANRVLAVTTASRKGSKVALSKIVAIKEKCHVCGSHLEIGNKKEMLQKAEIELEASNSQVITAEESVNKLDTLLSEIRKEDLEHSKYVRIRNSKEEAEDRLDGTKPTELFKSETLSKTISALELDITNTNKAIAVAIAFNSKVEADNATLDYKKLQLSKFEAEMVEHQKVLNKATVLNTRLDVLAKALGTKGLIAYKVESMVKVFEGLINQYLQVLADGEFALGFSVEDTKLVLNTYSRGKLIDIKSLSSGEFNRVNTATLLAVRKMMTSISKTDINLLILDEVVSVLDQEGKDTLIEVLLKETNLSSIVVSHGYEHPLANKVLVTKTDNISRLDTNE